MRIELRIFNPDLRSRVREILQFTQSASVSDVSIYEADFAGGRSVVRDQEAPDVLITDGLVANSSVVGGPVVGETLTRPLVLRSQLPSRTRLVRLGVDVRIPGEETHLLRIVESARRGRVFPVYVFSGLAGGVGTTSAALALLKELAKLDLRHIFVLDLVDDVAIRFWLAQDAPAFKKRRPRGRTGRPREFTPKGPTPLPGGPTILTWDEVTIDDDVVTSRIPPGLLAILPSQGSGPPPISEVEGLARTLSRVGPTVVDAGRFCADTVKLCQSIGANLILVGNRQCDQKERGRRSSKESRAVREPGPAQYSTDSLGRSTTSSGHLTTSSSPLTTSSGRSTNFSGHSTNPPGQRSPRAGKSDYTCLIAQARIESLGFYGQVTWLSKPSRFDRRTRKTIKNLAAESLLESGIPSISTPGHVGTTSFQTEVDHVGIASFQLKEKPRESRLFNAGVDHER